MEARRPTSCWRMKLATSSNVRIAQGPYGVHSALGNSLARKDWPSGPGREEPANGPLPQGGVGQPRKKRPRSQLSRVLELLHSPLSLHHHHVAMEAPARGDQCL